MGKGFNWREGHKKAHILRRDSRVIGLVCYPRGKSKKRLTKEKGESLQE